MLKPLGQQVKEFFLFLIGGITVAGAVLAAVGAFMRDFYNNNEAIIYNNALYWVLFPAILYAVRFRHRSVFIPPKVRKIMPNGLLLVEECEWLGHGTVVSLYRMKDDYEIFLTNAHAVNVQSNKLIQLRPISDSDEKIGPMDDFKDDIIIKPGTYK